MSAVSSFVGSQYSRLSVDSLFKATPATLEAAESHFQASRVSKRTAVVDGDLTSEDVCQCCNKRISGGRGACLFSLRDLDELAELGIAYPLFFYLLRYLCCMLLWITLIASIGNISYMYQNSSSTDPQYADDNTTVWPYILQLLSLLGLFVGYVLMTILMQRKEVELRKGVVTEADYSVAIKNLGTDWHSAALKQHIESQMLVNGKSLSVVKINTAYVLTDYLKVEEAVESIKQKKNLLRIQSQIHLSRWISNAHIGPISAARIESEQATLLTRVEAMKKNPPKKAGIAIVTFHTIEDANAFQKTWGQGLLRKLFWCCGQKKDSPLYFAGREIYVKAADQPGDIAWSNLHAGRGKRLMAQVTTLVIIVVAVVMLYVVMIIIAIFQVLGQSNRGIDGYLDKSTVSAMILAVGLGIDKLAKAMAKMEHHHSNSAHFVIIAYKLTCMQVFNTVFVSIFYALASQADGEDFYVALRKQMYSLLYMNAIVKPMLRLLTIDNVLYVARRWWASRQFRAGTSTLTQEDANETFELPEMDMAIWYSDALTKFMLASMYTPFVPTTAPLFLVGFFLDYWVAKFILLRFASTPKQFNGMMAMKMLEFVKFSIFLYGVGMMMFFPTGTAQNIAISAILLDFLYFIIPIVCYKCCCRCCFSPSKPSKTAGPFEEESLKFPHHEVTPIQRYEEANPITSSQAQNSGHTSLNSSETQDISVWKVVAKMNEGTVRGSSARLESQALDEEGGSSQHPGFNYQELNE